MKEKKIFLYTEHGYKEELIKNEINNKYLVNVVTPIFSFFERLHANFALTIGFVGQARKDKGFHLLPELILKLEKKKTNLNYLIQFTSANKDTEIHKNQLLSIAKDNPRIKIINKYLDFSSAIINETELRQELRDNSTDIRILVKKFIKRNKFKNMIITRGKNGALFVNHKFDIFFEY